MTDRELLENILDTMSNNFDSINKPLTNIEVHLENVTDKNIKIIAEGHMDLTRKLDDALKVENEKELLLIRMNYLENEMKKVKERLEQIA